MRSAVVRIRREICSALSARPKAAEPTVRRIVASISTFLGREIVGRGGRVMPRRVTVDTCALRVRSRR